MTGWNLPPGVTHRDIEQQAGGDEDIVQYAARLEDEIGKMRTDARDALLNLRCFNEEIRKSIQSPGGSMSPARTRMAKTLRALRRITR